MNSDENNTGLIEIGWREWLSLPDLGVPGIKAKVDTGARTSALHTSQYECFEDDSGQALVNFELHPLRGHDDCLRCENVPVSSFREVKDSGGHIEKRPFIETLAKLGDFEWQIELSLTNREQMKFRMLLGRTAIRKRFLVNSARSYLLGKSLSHLYE